MKAWVWWVCAISNAKTGVVQVFWPLLVLYVLVLVRDIAVVDAASVNFVNYDCSESDYSYSLGSTFEANLNNTLFTVLPANASLVHFSNFSNGTDIDKVYALYLCRRDIDATSCHDCVEAAGKKIVQVCDLKKQGIVWYQECMLHYANRSIFSLEQETPMTRDYNYSSIWSAYNLDPYQQEFDTTMQGLINQTAHNIRLQGFATKDLQLSSSQTLRGLMQCTPDILGPPCDKCLRAALKQRDSWPNTMIFLPSCLMRFDMYGSQTPTPAAPPARNTRKIILIALLSAIGFSLLLGGFLFWKIRHPAGSHEELPLQDGQLLSLHHNRQEDVPVLTDIPEPRDIGRPVGFARFLFSEVEKMTNNFEKILGEGGFGIVYYGLLTDGTTEVAVKVLSKDAPTQFSTEIEVFGKISHKNLVSLIGYCQDGTNLALIYEYMARGDLKALLSGSDPLSWKKRLEIAIDSAQGLDYLHNGCKPPIVHRDVKSPNILLNQQLGAKMADFGFSKIFPEEYVSALSTRVIGSPGYVDPEYHLTAQLKEKSDVYSFGVVLLELITGKAAIVGGESLVKWVRPMLDRGDMDSIADPRLQQVQTRASVWRVTDLAMECVKLNAEERPTMSLIVTELKECLAMEVDAIAGTSVASPNSMELMGAAVDSLSTMSPTAR